MIDRVTNPGVVGVPTRPTPTDAPLPAPPASAAGQPSPAAQALPAATAAPDAALASRVYDLAALSAAIAASSPVTSQSAEQAGRAVKVVEEAAARLLPASSAAALARLLQAISPGGPTEVTAHAIAERLATGGLLFETHARAVLAREGSGIPTPITAVLSDDLRVLLARLVRAAQSRPGSPGGPAVDEAKAVETGGLSDTESAATGVVAERVLAEQLHLAQQWISDASVAFELPLRLGDQGARALVRFRKEGGDAAGAGPAACVVSVQVASETLGAVSAVARWQSGTCHAAFFVDRPESVPALQAHVEGLRDGLGALFSRLAIDISVDAVRARRAPSSVPPPPQPGSVVSVRT